MRVALLIAGYLRNYKPSIEFIEKEILNKFHNVDVYLHITKNENLEDRYYNLINEDKDTDEIIKRLNPITTIIESNVDMFIDKSINNVFNQWQKLYKLNQIKKNTENTQNFKYDLVIRYRPDLDIKSTNIFNVKDMENTVYLPSESKIDKSKLDNKNDNYLCDAFAFGGSLVMDDYFSLGLINQLNKHINKSHTPETILYSHLKSNSIRYKTLDIDYSFCLSKCNVFAICGDSGSGKSTLSNLLKQSFSNSFMLECDRYHKWERNNENWNKLTHLNPEANYITKMHEDVFNLKIGKDIYQVDYDHYTGKFTEKQLINPSDNLIVCGLHSLYGDNNALYNLKIFMDTDETLKKKWKIKRDVKERGYSIEKVLNSIKKREEDYKKYILPQKEEADLVIKFRAENIDLYDLEKEENLILELKINDRFNIDMIRNILYENSIEYDLIMDSKTYVFKTYKPLKYDKIIPINNYYQYILFFISMLTN